MKPKYILALDQGTTSSRAVLFDEKAAIVGISQKETRQILPQPGWVEQSPEEIWSNQYDVAIKVIKENKLSPKDSGHWDHQSEGNNPSLGKENRKGCLQCHHLAGQTYF
jgi:sugar (pentulose or hexulose) kinase